eukprot:snap_masked-scaffold_2-processed-gene-18.40-mRNA-1 protein AED:1.00 eAED:1.00 QI:0/0/0/0/1/1/2/0/61
MKPNKVRNKETRKKRVEKEIFTEEPTGNRIHNISKSSVTLNLDILPNLTHSSKRDAQREGI